MILPVGRSCHQFVSGIERCHARQPANGQRTAAVAGGQRQGELRRADPAALRDHPLAAGEIESAPADVAGSRLLVGRGRQVIGVAHGIFLQQDRLRPGRDDRAGADPHRLTGVERSGERMARSALPDDPPWPLEGRGHGIAIHR
jgi:hypothetical protein